MSKVSEVAMSKDDESVTVASAAADQRRVDLLRSALEVIAERGFPDTRIADVAEQAGTSPALVIYYFKTKDNLLTEAMRYAEDLWYDLGARRMAVIESAGARLEEIVAMTCLSETDTELPDSWALWLDLWAQSVRRPEVARVREEFDAHWRETIASVVRDGIATGEFEKVDATRFAIMLSALLDGFAIQIALEDPAVDPQLAFRSTMEFAAMTLCFSWKPKKNGVKKNGAGR
jgi:AcrR family transcriptional regulator